MIKWIPYLLMAMLLSGCASGIDTPPHIRGFLFSYATTPYSPDLHDTQVSDFTGHGAGVRVKVPVSGYDISAEVDRNAIGDIARKNGIEEVYFADRKELNILSIWRQRWLYIYGE